MKILFITAFPPCQKTAGQDYSRRLINNLIKKGHSISIIYASYPTHNIELDESVELLSTIRPSLCNCLRNLYFHPFYTKRFEKKTITYIKKIAPYFDMLYFDFSQVHIYSFFIEHQNKVLMCHDIIAQKFMRKGFINFPWIKRSEYKLLKTANRIITFSQKDCNLIKKLYGLSSINVNFYLKNENFIYGADYIFNNRFCFYGAWNRVENTEGLKWFMKKVYPKLNSKLQIIIIGGGLTTSIQKKIKKFKNISYLGFVKNPLKEISRSQALIAPLYKGAGVKVKVIDAISSGTCVIGTAVAFEGIEDNHKNKLFFHAEKANDYISILNNWHTIKLIDKQNAADEFFNRYNTNHFPDLIS